MITDRVISDLRYNFFQAPANHWFFDDLGRGQTYYSDDDIKELRQSVSSKQEMLGLKMLGVNLVFVFLKFGETPNICFIPSNMGSTGSFLERAMNDLKTPSTKDDIPALKIAEYEQKVTRELLKVTFEEAIFSYFIIFLFVFCMKLRYGDDE